MVRMRNKHMSPPLGAEAYGLTTSGAGGSSCFCESKQTIIREQRLPHGLWNHVAGILVHTMFAG
jgi:hypothetical protein